MHQIFIYFNCHGTQIQYYLNMSQYIKSNCKILLQSSYSTDPLSTDTINYIKNSDYLIIQYIENERIHTHKTILSYKNENAKFIILPHYRTSIYDYFNLTDNSNLININYSQPVLQKDLCEMLSNNLIDKSVFENKFNQISINDKNKINIFIEKNIKEFIELENNIKKKTNFNNDTYINMSEFFINNYKEYRLFGCRFYPRPYFFYNLTKEILKNWNINDMKNYVECPIDDWKNWYHTIVHIPLKIKEEFNFTFEEKYPYYIKNWQNPIKYDNLLDYFK